MKLGIIAWALWHLALTQAEDVTNSPQVVFASDAGQFEGMAAAIASLVTGTKEVEVTIVTSTEDAKRAKTMARCAGARKVRVVGWEETNVTRLPQLKRSDFFDSKHKKESLATRQDLSSMSNFVRFYLPEVLDSDDATLYLDSDVVVQCDVGKFLSGCRDQFHRQKHATILVAPRNESHPRRLTKRTKGLPHQHLEDHEAIFNAGVFVADLHRWKKRNATGRIEQLFFDVQNMIHVNLSAAAWHRPSSQAPMTRVFGESNEYAYLDDPWSWNHRLTVRSKSPKDKHVCLLHFTGAAKPWHTLEKHILRQELEVELANKTDPQLKKHLAPDSKLHGLPWWITLWLPHARPCCVPSLSVAFSFFCILISGHRLIPPPSSATGIANFPKATSTS